MAYSIAIAPAAFKAIEKANAQVRKRIGARISSLAANPRPDGVKKLKGELAGYYRVRVGDYRVVYTIDDRLLVVLILEASDRKDTY